MAKTVLLFPGQGAQAVGMGSNLTQRSPKAKSLFDRASEILGYDLLVLCTQGPESQLNATSHSQPALFVHAMAALADLSEQKPEVVSDAIAVAGLSLGEYSAACAAGAITFEDGVKLVHERGTAMQEAAESSPSGMASVLGLDLEKVTELCNQARQPGEILQVANLLCPGNIAISGHVASLDAASQVAEQMGAMKFIRLSVAGAFHTDLMLPAKERLAQAIAATPMQTCRIPLISNVDAQPHTAPSDLQALFPKQLVSPVRWEDSLRHLIAMGAEQFFEIGAGRVLAGTLKRIDRKAACECFGD